MSNERITEQIVRDHFRNDPLFRMIKLEEQKSSLQRINLLLRNASKNGEGQGRPEFIITFPSGNVNYLILIECKAKRNQHESPKRDKPKDYAVDGVLHYAKFLSLEFNVIAIAVSGDDSDNLDVSQFIFGNNNQYTELSNKKLLSIYDYSKTFNQEKYADNLLNMDIIQKAIYLNKQFQDLSITELHRCTMVSAILIALMDTSFRNGYINQSSILHLAEFLQHSVGKELDKANVRNKEAIINEYKTILNQPLFSQMDFNKRPSLGIAKEIIGYLADNVYPLTQMDDVGFDVLGRFYSEFVRYAGDQASQGLVLTPFHITALFCDIARINAESIVYDPCCGTGSFLISAMKAMMNIAASDNSKKIKIKNEQLIGVEKRPEMFAYACSNMMLRGDGKSNIYYGDCFSLAQKIKENHQPTVSFLNPPYDVGNADQMRFVEHAIDIVSPQNGLVVAIVQMSCAIKKEKELLAIKKSILSKHHLRAVFSMPNELFYPVGVVTAVLVFQSNLPNKNNKTWFGYFKEDGFEKRKHKGRIDIKDQWKYTKDKWINIYHNMEEVSGLSIKREVGFSDEWCAEAYMETDYSKITKSDFERFLREYVAFKFLNQDWL